MNNLPKLYWCENCQWFHHRKSLFNIYKYKGDTCQICKNKLKVFEVPHTNWVKIGFPIVIIIGIFLGLWGIYEFYKISLFNPLYPSIIVTLLLGFGALLIILGFGLGISIIDDHIIANKILKDNPELEKKKNKIKYNKLQNHCEKCNKEIPNRVKKCPYCGQEQY